VQGIIISVDPEGLASDGSGKLAGDAWLYTVSSYYKHSNDANVYEILALTKTDLQKLVPRGRRRKILLQTHGIGKLIRWPSSHMSAKDVPARS